MHTEFLSKSEGKRWENNIRMDLKWTGLEVMEQIYLAH
jgi:hypothetical protein